MSNTYLCFKEERKAFIWAIINLIKQLKFLKPRIFCERSVDHLNC